MRASAPPTLQFSPELQQATRQQQVQNELTAKVANYRKALAALPNDAHTYLHIANCLKELEQFDEAEAAYQRAIELDPSSALILCHYGELLTKAKRNAQAIPIYQAALLLDPDNATTHNSLGMALQATGKLDLAIAAYQQMLMLMPGSAVAYNNIGSIQQAQGQTETAIQNFRRAVEIEPRFSDAHCNLGTCLMNLGRYEESLESNLRSIALNPEDLHAHTNISAVLNTLGRIDEAIEHCRLALTINPGWAYVHSNLLFSISHSALTNPAQLLAEHRRFAAQFETPLRAQWPQHANERDPARRLRIGFVSADLNNHAVASFITPVLENLQHAPGLELLAYCNSPRNDDVTQYLRTLMSAWRQVEHLSDADLARQIISDGIDILIDLSGHTGHNRLQAFARKPAPLQLSWIGYPGTTGLEAMDYYLTDRFYSPPGLLDDQFTEKLLRLPACVPFLPSPLAPPVSPAPASEHGYITFGSFNRANKLSRDVIARWSKLLHALPDARMVLAGMPSEHISNKLRAWFAREGIRAERLSFYARTDIGDYLALHRLVDVCLDTFPYAGGTTTFHALWMGVPTLTMTGSTLPSRVGAMVLEHAGLHDFIAQDEADFIRKGKLISGNIPHLAALRFGMRTRMNNSPIGQPALIAAGLEDALRSMWQRWCAELPPVSFDADPEQSSLQPRALSLKALNEVNVDAALLLAIEHHQAGRFVEAETLYLAIIHSLPQHAIANHNMGLLAEQLGFHDDALPYLRTAMSANPDEIQFCHSYAQALMQAGQTELAMTTLSGAIERGTGTAESQALLARAQAAMAGADTTPTQAEADRIVELYQAGSHVEMENAAQALVARYPASGFAWSALGTALQALGKDALPPLQRAVQLTPEGAQAHADLGNAWQGTGEYGAAIECYLRAIALDPALAEAYGNMGSAQHAMGDAAAAADSFRKALHVEPAYALAHANLGNVLATLGHLEDATTSYRAALALVPDDVQLHRDLGNVLLASGRDEEAADSYRQANAFADLHPPV